MVELLQTSNESTANDHQVAESLSAMLNGGGSSRRRAQLVNTLRFLPCTLLAFVLLPVFSLTASA